MKKYLIPFLVVIVVFTATVIFIHSSSQLKRDARRAGLRAKLDNFSVSISPSIASIKSGLSQQFLVTETNVQNPNGKWTVDIGTIDTNGLYTSPPVTTDTQANIAFVTDTGASSTASLTVISPVDGPATLPQNTVASSMADTPTPGVVTQVAPLGLQNALNVANCGDALLLQAGSTYPGSYTLPAKNCDDQHWIVIRSSAPDSLLPAEGTRLNPCYAEVSSLPGRPSFDCPENSVGVTAKIVAAKGVAAITLAPNANHYRIGPGLEITRSVGDGINFGLIVPSNKAAADHIIVDRDWVHGTAQDETTRGVFLSGITIAGVIDSYLSDFHCVAVIGQCVDAQAIAGGTGQIPGGTYKIDHNFLEGAAETILFGGVLKNSVTPADITITRNHMFKPFTWMPGQAGFVGGKETTTLTCPKLDPNGLIGQCPFVVKNLFELKNAQRVLLEGNLLEDVWPGFSQYGDAVLLSGLNPEALAGDPIYSTISIDSVTARYNRIAHITAGISVANMAGQGSGTPSATINLPVSNVSVHDNILDDMNPAYLNGATALPSALKMFQITSCPVCVPLKGIAFSHNTALAMSPKTGFIFNSPIQQLDYTFTNNLVTIPGTSLAILDASGAGCASTGNTPLMKLNNCLRPNYNFAGNALVGAASIWPSGNYFPTSPTTVGFTNVNGLNGGDYTLLPASPYKGKATDGKDPGANVSLVNQATAGVN